MGAIVVIAASAGGLEPLRRIIAALPLPCAASVFVVRHIGCNTSVLPFLLARAGLPASLAREGVLIEAGHIYVAPPDHHMILEPHRIRLSHGPKVNHTRPAADPLFETAAEAYGNRVVGVVLSGGGSDGAAGLQAIKAHCGTAFVQHPDEATAPSMPKTAIAAGQPDACLPVSEIAQRVRCIMLAGPSQRLFTALILGGPLSKTDCATICDVNETERPQGTHMRLNHDTSPTCLRVDRGFTR
jgi:two-component system chemotaxis response regulator CheB